MSEPGDGHGPAHTGQEARNDALPERRVWKRILILPVTVHQSTSDLMEEARVYSNTRNIGPHRAVCQTWRETVQGGGGGTWTHCAGQTRPSPHASPTNGPDRRGPNPSTPRTIRLGNATAEPSPDGRWSYGHPTPARSIPHRQGKNPGIVAKRPVGPTPTASTTT